MNRSRPVAYFSLQTQFENLGDCIINELVIRELAKYAQVRIIQNRAPTWLLDRLAAVDGVETYKSKPRWFADLFRRLALRRPVVFAFKPGHYLSSSRARSVVYSAALVAFCSVCRLQGGKVIRTGVSLDRFSGLQSRLQSMLGRLHSSYGVRDRASLEYARQLGVTTACYSPDIAFLLDAPNLAPSKVLSSSHSSTAPETEDSVNVDSWPRRKLSLSFRKQGLLKDSAHVAALAQALKGSTTTHNLEAVVVEQVTFDRDLATDLCSRLNCPLVRFEQSELSVSSVFQNYAESRAVVSNRLHSLLFGWSEGAIPIPVVDNTPHSKIVELFKVLGLEELVLLSSDIERLPGHVESVLANEAARRAHLWQVFREQRTTLQAVMADCFAKSDLVADVRQSVGGAIG
jgi:polysaccharide pyruvyl transferase WcaK-like protein